MKNHFLKAIFGILVFLVVTTLFGQSKQLTSERHQQIRYEVENFLKNNQIQQADSVLDQYTSYLETDPQIILLKAKIWEKRKKYKKASSLLKKILVLDPLNKQAYNELGYVIYLQIKGKKTPHPTVKNYWISLFKERKAINYLKKALEIDSTYVDAKRNLALVYQNSLNRKKIEAASKLLEKINEAEDFEPHDTYILGAIEYDLKKWDIAEKYFLRSLTKDPTLDQSFFKLSQICFRKGEMDYGTRYYYLALENLKEPELINELFWDFRLVASNAEVDSFRAASSKGAFLLKFWKSKDPTPTTIQNEFLNEFYHRKELAKEKFPSAAYRAYDDRGTIFIRYGPPDEKMVDLSEQPNLSWDTETWVYRHLTNTDVIFEFIRVGTDYFLIDNLSEAMRIGRQSVDNLRRLLERRTHLSPIFTKYLARFDLLTTNETQENTFRGNMSLDSRALNILNEMDMEMKEARSHAPPSYFHLNVKPINVSLYAANFKAGKEIQHEVYFGVPYRDLKFEPLNNDSLQSDLKISLNLKDENFNSLSNFVLKRKIRVPKKIDIQKLYYLDELVSRLKPGVYNMGIVIENPQSGKKFIRRYRARLTEFPVDSLALSDIEISPHLKPQPYPLDIDDWLKENFLITPYPFFEVRKDKPFYVYFEIYNLTLNKAGQANYSVEYQVERQSGKKNLGSLIASLNPFGGNRKSSLTVQNTRQEFQKNVAEYVALDFSKLKKGNYILRVIVKDLNKPGRTAIATRPIHIGS